MKQDKQEQLTNWLEANPGKESEDWLLEVRCKDEKQRAQVAEILRLCEENNLVYRIPFSYPGEPKVWFDFAVHGHPIDLDAPDELFEDINPNRRWEAGERYLSWKAVYDLGEGYETDYGHLFHEDYFHDNFYDWRDHEFLEGFALGKKFNWNE